MDFRDWSRPLTYYLDERGEPVGVTLGDTLDPRYIEWFEHAWEPGPRSRRIAQNTVDGYHVSTVFLMVDHQFGHGPPVLWETMIFAVDDEDQQWSHSVYCRRYTSREDARQGHADTVAALLGGKKPEELD